MVAEQLPTHLLGIGLYRIPEAARILDVAARRDATHAGQERRSVTTTEIRRWAYGYSRGGREHPAVVSVEVGRVDDTDILTFRDLIQLRFVAAFRREGVSMQSIRRAASIAAERWAQPYPLAIVRFRTDGRTIFGELLERGESDTPRQVEDLIASQMVFDTFMQPYYRDVDIAADVIARFWPLGRHRRVVLDPLRAFGEPIDTRSGIPTRVIHAASQSGDPPDDVAFWYDIDLEAVADAVEYERELRAT